MRVLTQDLRLALRQLRKRPSYSVLATLTLAIGIGASTAMFSLVNTVLLRPLPFPEPDRLVGLDTLSRPAGSTGAATIPSETSYLNLFDWRAQAKSFVAIGGYHGDTFTLSEQHGTAAVRVFGLHVTADVFPALGVPMALGRSFTRDEELPGNRSVVLSPELWRTRFNQSRDVVGKSLRINDVAYTVVGVLPEGFHFPGNSDLQIYVTPATDGEGKQASLKQRGWQQLDIIGLLAPGVTIEQARAEMRRIQRGISAEYPDDARNAINVSVEPEQKVLVGESARPLRILFAAVCFLLLIACANVGGLLLTRVAARRPELALRAALGARRVQIVRQLLIESLLLSTIAGALGFLLAAFALRLAPAYLPEDLPRLVEIGLDPSVFFFAVVISIATGLVFGVLPAGRTSRVDPALALRDGGRASMASPGRHRLHSALVVGETALGLLLLISAGLLLRSFNRILHVDPGFSPQHMLTFRLALPLQRTPQPQQLHTYDAIKSRLESIPGVEQVTYGFPLPLSRADMSITFSIAGRPDPRGEAPSARCSVVAWNFFETLKLPLRRGHLFTLDHARPDSNPVVIINQAFADRFFPGQDAIGQHMTSGVSDQLEEIIGIVGNVKRTSLTEQSEPEYYVPFAQATIAPPTFALRVSGAPVAYAETVRKVIAAQDSSVPVFSIRSYDELLARSVAQRRFQAMLLGAFAAIALLLAALGLYAVLSYMVQQRTPELGLRLALGASRSDVLRLVLRRGVGLSVVGLGLGLLLSTALTRAMAALLFATEPLDLATFVVTTALLFAVALAASLVPALRAARLDPNQTLRQL